MAAADAVERAVRHSSFLAAAIGRHPELARLLRIGSFRAARAAIDEIDDRDTRRYLRRKRDALALVVAIADLAGAMALEDVVAVLSDFADEALNLAIENAILTRAPNAVPKGFVGIALGKHGSRELNYSSDIDAILLYDPSALPRGSRDDADEVAVRIARAIVDVLQSRDANGYVFRVDLRLRPASEATPLALSVDAAISHYESSALGWERAAFIRARAAAGDTALGDQFLATIQPFIWRRSLDFGAVEELRAMSRRIRAHHSRGQVLGPGYDLKRGRGGIREIEFFVQIHQLIHGGRDRTLRVPDTLGGIRALEWAALLDGSAAEALRSAYRTLRTIEHRLQMVDDRQTHSLPLGDSALEDVAHLHGLGSGSALLDLLGPHIDAVGTLYDGLDPAPKPSVPHERDSLRELLASAGFRETAAAAARITEWRSGKLRALRNAAALQAFEAALPDLVISIARAPDPLVALHAFDTLLSGLPSAINLFRLIEARPALLEHLVEIISHAPPLSEALGRNPALLDRLLDATALNPVAGVEELVAEMTAAAPVTEIRLDRVRQIVGEHRFALGVQIVAGASDPLQVAGGYARVAEAAVRSIADAVVADFVGAHGTVPNSELVILALGRLGGGELTHASDLDLIYLFTGDFAAESVGARPLGASHYYNRLGQRLSTGLSVPTSAGALYEVDTRLRPSGGDGPLVVSSDSFARYQAESAWTWEHMALTRARVVYGSADARAEVEAHIADVLRRPRPTAPLARDVVAMRSEMAAQKPPKGPVDVKLFSGGLVDLEFLVHFHQLAHRVGLKPNLSEATAALVDAGLLGPNIMRAHEVLSRLVVTLRLLAPGGEIPAEATQPVVARACRVANWADLVAEMQAARQCVEHHWRAVVEQAD